MLTFEVLKIILNGVSSLFIIDDMTDKLEDDVIVHNESISFSEIIYNIISFSFFFYTYRYHNSIFTITLGRLLCILSKG